MAILLVEDDKDLGQLLKQYLMMNEMDIVLVHDGKAALGLLDTSKFELAVIDIMLPDISGFEIARKSKNVVPDMPFLFLTAKNNKEDIIHGLKLGADDYIVKPFEPEELVLRIKIALRRNQPDNESSLLLGNSVLIPEALKFKTPVKEYKLTQRESALMEYIIKNKNRLLKRELMLKAIWGENDFFMGRSMDVFISRLRNYFLDDPIIKVETFRGVGYIFRDQ